MLGVRIVKEQNVGQDMRYYELLDQLVSAMTAAGEADVSQIEQILGEIARLFRLCKGVTRLYRSLDEEKEGGGETFCSFDIGEGEPVAFQRVVTSGMAIATMTVYMQSGIRPLSSEERRLVELIMRLTLSFVCRNRMQRSIEDLAFFDYDGYRNTRSLQNHFMQTERTGRFVGLAVVRYNLRHFTVVNQELGREKANAVLRSHYKTVEERVGAEGIVCRLSGDDFVAVCRKERLEKLLDCLLETRISYDEQSDDVVTISANAGVFVVPEGFVLRSPDDIRGPLLSAYMAAMSGKQDHIVFYDDKLAREREKITHVQQDFIHALREEEYYPVYQPKVNIRTGKICGAEALCRWCHDGRTVSPGDFIPALEETSDICRLDFYMLDHVCRDIRRWLDAGLPVLEANEQTRPVGVKKHVPPELTWLDGFCAEPGYHILLCHHPEYYPRWLRERPIELILSGHAHGGQVRILGQGLYAPGQGVLPKLTSGVTEGRLVISRGLANCQRVPRLFNPPELVYVLPEK